MLFVEAQVVCIDSDIVRAKQGDDRIDCSGLVYIYGCTNKTFRDEPTKCYESHSCFYDVPNNKPSIQYQHQCLSKNVIVVFVQPGNDRFRFVVCSSFFSSV